MWMDKVGVGPGLGGDLFVHMIPLSPSLLDSYPFGATLLYSFLFLRPCRQLGLVRSA